MAAFPVASEPRLGTEPVPGFPAALETEREDAFAELPMLSVPVRPLLINGVEADRRNFPTLFRKVSGSHCTAALVGPATMLTAAHCMSGNSHVQFRLREARVRGYCERDPQYPADQSQDWALCLLEFPVLDVRYETVAVSLPAFGTRVTLTGFGCTTWGGPSDGTTLRIGVASLVPRPSGFPVESSSIYTQTNVAAGGVIVCPGDSGGPLFVIPSGSLNSARTIVGVNSRASINEGVSLFSASGSAAGSDFIKKWARRRQQNVCGINTDNNCR